MDGWMLKSKGGWNRVRVLNISENDVTCFFIDYGDEHVVSRSNVYNLHVEYSRYPAQAFICRLSGLEELASMSACNDHLENLVGKIFLAQPHIIDELGADFGPSAIPVTFFNIVSDENEVVYNEEMFLNVNQSLIHHICAASVAELDYKNINPVYITHCTKNSDIYVQLYSEAHYKVNELIKALDEIDFNVELPGPHIPRKDSSEGTSEEDSKRIYLIRLSKGDDNGRLYRAKIIDRSPCGQFVCFYLIDTGRTEICSVKESGIVFPLEKISEVLCAFPPLAIRVQLNLDLSLKKDTKFMKDFKEFVLRKQNDLPFILKVLHNVDDEDGNPIPFCDLFWREQGALCTMNKSMFNSEVSTSTEDRNNNDKSIQLAKKLSRLQVLSDHVENCNKPVPSTGFLPSPKLPKLDEYFDVSIACAVNPWNFFVQPYESRNQLLNLMAKLQEKYNNTQAESLLELKDVLPGKIYASKYTDNMWYRTSVIKVINPGSISVFYCDFGYYANLTINQLVPLNSEFLNLPYQAIKARLAGVQPRDKKWTIVDCEEFVRYVQNRSFVSVVENIQQDELYQCDSIVTLKLIDTTTQKDVYMAEFLIEKGIGVSVNTINQ